MPGWGGKKSLFPPKKEKWGKTQQPSPVQTRGAYVGSTLKHEKKGGGRAKKRCNKDQLKSQKKKKGKNGRITGT